MTERDGDRLEGVLTALGADGDAVEDGRVFIGKVRARSVHDVVKPGDAVHVSAKAESPAPATLLADEDGLVAANKPADLPTIPDHGGASSSLLASVARALGVPSDTLHPTSRLDRDVSGVVLFARTKAAAERLRQARDDGTYARRYAAIAGTAPREASGVWDAPIGRAKDPRHRMAHGKDPTPALSRFAVVGTAGPWALLALDPLTGRTHQLRVHAAHGGAPLLGDRVYGGPSRVTLASGRVLAFARIALHAARVRVPRADGTLLEVVAPIPSELRDWWRAQGGRDGAWDDALAVFTAPPG